MSITPKHRGIFPAMLKQVDKVDFQFLAFPEIVELRDNLKAADSSGDVEAVKAIQKQIDRCKPTQKQIIVLGVDYLLNFCRANKWQLAAQHGRVYLYNCAYWQAVDENDLKQFLGQALEKMGVRFVDAKYFRFRDDLTKQFFTSAHLPAPERDRGTVCINLKNGTLSVGIDGVHLREFRPEDFLRYQLAFDYDPAATAPKWQFFLDEMLPDPEAQRVLSEALALAFLSSSVRKLEKIPMFQGEGDNGKSVVMDTFRAVLGSENVSGHSLKLLTGNENARANLQDVLINVSSEIGGIADSDVFKLLASGEPVSAKILYQDVHTMEDYGRIICNANKLPAEVENSHAFFRRFLIIPFSVTIDPAKKDTNLSKKIIETELPGILNWILQGLARLLKQNNFSPCKAADQALQQYRHESNTVSLWLEDASYTVSTSGHELPRGTLMSEYQAFCKAEKFNAVGGKNFTQRMRAAGFEQHRKSAGFVYFAVKVSSFGEGVQDGPF
jgi:putative DNA primase/helicase